MKYFKNNIQGDDTKKIRFNFLFLSKKKIMEASSQTNQKQDIRVYLEDKVFPILTNGLEELLRAVEERDKKAKEEEDVPEIQPLFFLARYLMKNSPTATQKNEKKEQERLLAEQRKEEEEEQKERENENESQENLQQENKEEEEKKEKHSDKSSSSSSSSSSRSSKSKSSSEHSEEHTENNEN